MSAQTELKWVRWRSRLGFPLAAVCLWLARPSAASILGGGIVAITGLVIRAVAAGHLSKNKTVAMSGPYAHTRNPLYLGSAFMVAGFGLASRSWLGAALVVAYYLAMYPFLMRREERELSAQFGKTFDEYARRVPLFWPRLRTGASERGAFSWSQYLRNREYQTAVGTVALLLSLWAISIWRR